MRALRPLLVLGGIVATLAVAAPASAAPASLSWNSNWFQSPTGNLRCRYWPSDRLLGCTTLNNARMVAVTLFGSSFVRRSFGYSFPGGPVLTYGDSWSVRNKFRCNSSFNGMRCVSLQTGFGFFINRTSYRLF